MSLAIPAPTVADGMTEEEVAKWHADQATLQADPRTAGNANRPKWLVDRVLAESTVDCALASNTGRGAVLDGHSSIRKFVLAGNARFTLVSKKTSERYTYRVRAADNASKTPVHFVYLLTGSNNEFDYSYIGSIVRGHHGLLRGRDKSKAPGKGMAAFEWFWTRMGDHVPDTIEFWHEGRCGRCSRALTVPESVSSGFGPECGQR
jgi:hypothetical protein